MYVRMYVFVYVCVYVWMCVCMCVCMDVCMYVCVYVCMCDLYEVGRSGETDCFRVPAFLQWPEAKQHLPLPLLVIVPAARNDTHRRSVMYVRTSYIYVRHTIDPTQHGTNGCHWEGSCTGAVHRMKAQFLGLATCLNMTLGVTEHVHCTQLGRHLTERVFTNHKPAATVTPRVSTVSCCTYTCIETVVLD